MKSIFLHAFSVLCACCIIYAEKSFASPLTLSPHRAVYDLSLVKTNGDNQAERVEGRIALEFNGNICEGFTFTSRQLTKTLGGDSKVKNLDIRVRNWESGSGLNFKFKNITREEGNIAILSEGMAVKDGNGDISVKLRQPHPVKLDLDGQALFPTSHTRALIELARNNMNFLNSKIFDGSDEGIKIFNSSAVIGKEIPAGSNIRSSDVMRRAGLNNIRRWPITASYFEEGAGEKLPVYQLQYDLSESGISTSLIFNFDGFALKGELVYLEILDSKRCKINKP